MSRAADRREQSRDPMDKNRIGGCPGRTSGRMTAKFTAIKGLGQWIRRVCGEGGRAYLGRSAVCPELGLRTKRFVLTGRQKSAEGVLGTRVLKARTVPAKGLMGAASKRRDS